MCYVLLNYIKIHWHLMRTILQSLQRPKTCWTSCSLAALSSNGSLIREKFGLTDVAGWISALFGYIDTIKFGLPLKLLLWGYDEYTAITTKLGTILINWQFSNWHALTTLRVNWNAWVSAVKAGRNQKSQSLETPQLQSPRHNNSSKSKTD